MEEKKLNDEEIVKALECCSSALTEEACKKCPLRRECVSKSNTIEELALDLINRQKAEIERLTEENGQLKGYNSGLEYEVEQLQKQMDELNRKLSIVERCEDCLTVGKAIKDTAKEIFERLAKRKHQGVDLGGFFVEYHLRLEDLNWFEVKYGVEVE